MKFVPVCTTKNYNIWGEGAKYLFAGSCKIVIDRY